MTAVQISCTGGRDINEDFVDCAEYGDKEYCFILADGLGGHGNGNLASQTAVQCVKEAFEREGGMQRDFLKNAFLEAQNAVLQKQTEEKAVSQMRTTLVVLTMNPVYVQWSHVGDSRLYVFRNQKVAMRTKDHSVPQLLADAGEIQEQDIRGHADRSRLLRAIGSVWDEPKCEVNRKIPADYGEAFLLCSDGFWELIEEKKMEECLKLSSSAFEWMQRMKAIVEENGEGTDMDNYSAIAIIRNDLGGGEADDTN